jgi:ABC-type nitrate/sulfonate/bicarbonate transport system substrate-binding protein
MLRSSNCLTAAAVFGAAFAVAGPAAAEDVSVALPAHSLTFSTNYIGDELGLWSKRGLTTKTTLIPGVGSANAVLAGSVDVTVVSGPTVIRAAARGQKLLIIATTLDRVQVELVLAKATAEAAGLGANASLQSRVGAMRGKKFAVESINSVVHATLRYVARKGGLDPERDIVVSAMQPPAMLAGLKSGAIDGFAMSLPWPLIPVQQGAAVRIASGLRGEFPELMPFAYTALVARPDFCDAKPSICERIVAGYGEAADYLHQKPKESIEILKKRLPAMDPGVFAEAFELVRQSTPKSPRIEETGLARAQDFMLVTGMMTEGEKLASFKDIYTNKFVK